MKYTFIGDATYALMLYLLYATDEMIKDTVYFVGDNCGACNIPNKIIMPRINPYTEKELIKYRINCLKYRRQLLKSEIYAQDHVFFAAPLIDNIPYNVLEDCPNFFNIREERHEIKFRPTPSSLFYNWKVGRIYMRYAGHNPWCKKRIITSDVDKVLFEKQQLSYEQINLNELWTNASEFKKKYIIDAFSLPSTSHIYKDVVLFSQPLMHDASFTESEVINLFRLYIDKYGADNILVKVHPRDKFDYEKAFPGITSLRTKAPQQLLDIMGVKFKTAITVCSSAVSTLDKNCDIIWIGAEVDSRIVKAYGKIKNPRL